MSDEELMALMKTVEPLAVRVPPGIKQIVETALASLTKELAEVQLYHKTYVEEFKFMVVVMMTAIDRKGRNADEHRILLEEVAAEHRPLKALTPSSDHLEAYVRERMGEPVAHLDWSQPYCIAWVTSAVGMPHGTELYALPAVSDGEGG